MITATAPPMRLKRKRWKRIEYEKMVASGVLKENDKLELVEGELFEKMTLHPPHASVMMAFQKLLSRQLPDGYEARNQLPIALSGMSEPEPDFAVVIGSSRDYSRQHPTTALWIIEVAESSLAYDRIKKGNMYAKAGISDYWIVNINERVIEVYRDPIKVNGRGRWQTQLKVAEGETATPLHFTEISVAVTDILP
jgi:Uma2 family endonuclease